MTETTPEAPATPDETEQNPAETPAQEVEQEQVQPEAEEAAEQETAPSEAEETEVETSVPGSDQAEPLLDPIPASEEGSTRVASILDEAALPAEAEDYSDEQKAVLEGMDNVTRVTL